MTHDEVVRALRKVVRRVSPERAAEAFVATLGSAPVGYRSALKSWAYACNLPAHAFLPSLEMAYLCAVCGMGATSTDAREAVCAAVEKGELASAAPAAALYDLERFLTLPNVRATDEDWAVFRRMLQIAARAPAKTTAPMLGELWAKLIPRSKRGIRAQYAGVLGMCSVLQTADHPGFVTRFLRYWEQNESPRLTNELETPASFWTAADGLDHAALDRWFPRHGLARSKPKKTVPRRSVPESVTLARIGLTLSPGDVVDLVFRGRHFLAVVLGSDGKGLPVVEFYAGSFTGVPSLRELRSLGAHTVGRFRDQPVRRRQPYALCEMDLYPRVMHVPLTVVATAMDRPRTKAADAPYRTVLGRNLLYLLQTIAVTV